MSTFCLVHGSTQSPKGWDLLVAQLRTRGHECVCVDLPTGEPDASATVYASCIGAALENVNGAIVVAQSASGLFLPLVPRYASVGRLVYLAAVMPLPGESFREQFQKHPEMFRPDFVGKDPTVDPDLGRKFLFHDCSPKIAEWANSTLRLMYAKQAIVETTPLDRWPDTPSAYISCTEDRTIDPDWWERAARERLGVEPIRIAAGHAPHVSRPAELAEILINLAAH